jgi:hypothetical protein
MPAKRTVPNKVIYKMNVTVYMGVVTSALTVIGVNR